jgi:hypothetical protein
VWEPSIYYPSFFRGLVERAETATKRSIDLREVSLSTAWERGPWWMPPRSETLLHFANFRIALLVFGEHSSESIDFLGKGA